MGTVRDALVAVGVGLEGPLLLDRDVVGLLSGQLGQLNLQRAEVQACHLFVQNLGEHVHVSPRVLAGLPLLPQLDLSERLVRERGGHDERRVTSGAAQVEQASLSEEDDAVAVLEDELVHLGLDVDLLRGRDEAGEVDLVVEVADIADDGVVLHLGHVARHDDALVSGGGDEDVAGAHDGAELHNAEAFHRSLYRTQASQQHTNQGCSYFKTHRP